jgi:vacuole morphology and inheritance protein 14
VTRIGDPSPDIRTATQAALSDFLREINEAADVHSKRTTAWRARKESEADRMAQRKRTESAVAEESESSPEEERADDHHEEEREEFEEDQRSSDAENDSGLWTPGQGVRIDHPAIVEILLQHLDFPGMLPWLFVRASIQPQTELETLSDEEIQATCLRWIAAFLVFFPDVMISFTPRLIPVILSSLAHHVPAIRQAANQTNINLHRVIQNSPSSPKALPRPSSFSSDASSSAIEGVSAKDRALPSSTSQATASVPFPSLSRRHTPRHSSSRLSSFDQTKDGTDIFDYQATVSALTLQFLNQNEESRVAALEWLAMLHLKAPKKVRSVV